MKQIVFIEGNQAVTDSLTVAEVFGKRHDTVLRDIEVQIEKFNKPAKRNSHSTTLRSQLMRMSVNENIANTI